MPATGILPAYPPADASGIVMSYTGADGHEMVVVQDYLGRLKTVRVAPRIHLTSSGQAFDIHEQPAQAETAATGTAETQTGNPLTRAYVAAASWVQDKIDAVGSWAVGSTEKWHNFKTKVKRNYEGVRDSTWGKAAGIAGFAVGTITAIAAGVAVLPAIAIGGIVGLAFKFVGGLSDTLFAGGGTLEVSPGVENALDIAEAGWMTASTIAGFAAPKGSIPAGIKSIANNAKYRPGSWKPRFPQNPDDFLPGITRENTPNGFKMDINDSLRVRYETHGQIPGKPFCPRHHSPHYHVEWRPEPSEPWGAKLAPNELGFRPRNKIKIRPPGYVSGSGTGFLPGEAFPWELITNL